MWVLHYVASDNLLYIDKTFSGDKKQSSDKTLYGEKLSSDKSYLVIKRYLVKKLSSDKSCKIFSSGKKLSCDKSQRQRS